MERKRGGWRWVGNERRGGGLLLQGQLATLRLVRASSPWVVSPFRSLAVRPVPHVVAVALSLSSGDVSSFDERVGRGRWIFVAGSFPVDNSPNFLPL